METKGTGRRREEIKGKVSKQGNTQSSLSFYIAVEEDEDLGEGRRKLLGSNNDPTIKHRGKKVDRTGEQQTPGGKKERSRKKISRGG